MIRIREDVNDMVLFEDDFLRCICGVVILICKYCAPFWYYGLVQVQHIIYHLASCKECLSVYHTHLKACCFFEISFIFLCCQNDEMETRDSRDMSSFPDLICCRWRFWTIYYRSPIMSVCNFYPRRRAASGVVSFKSSHDFQSNEPTLTVPRSPCHPCSRGERGGCGCSEDITWWWYGMDHSTADQWWLMLVLREREGETLPADQCMLMLVLSEIDHDREWLMWPLDTLGC